MYYLTPNQIYKLFIKLEVIIVAYNVFRGLDHTCKVECGGVFFNQQPRNNLKMKSVQQVWS